MKLILNVFFALWCFTCSVSAQVVNLGPSHWKLRIEIAQNVVSTIGQNRIMFLGDSIAEQFWWNQLNNQFVLNAGQGGGGIDVAIATANALLPLARSKVVIVLIGVNDCVIGNEADPNTWANKYNGLLATIRSYGAVPVALSILPVEQDPNKTLGASYFNTSCITALNAKWWAIVTARNEIYVNLNYVFAVPPSNIYMRPGWTIDGVHPNGIGMPALYNAMVPAVAQAMAQTP